MIVSRTRSILAGAACAALPLKPVYSGAQSLTRSGYNIGRNLTQQTQDEINIALPSIAPLVDRVTPAVVNISVELKARTAAEDESDTGDESALLFRPGSTPFDQFLHRLLE